MAKLSWIRGFTTNPTLMKAARVSDYAAFARELVAAVPDRHISFEVFSDDIAEMVRQARLIGTWGAMSTRSFRCRPRAASRCSRLFAPFPATASK